MVSDLLQAGPDCAHALIWCANQCACGKGIDYFNIHVFLLVSDENPLYMCTFSMSNDH